MGSQRKRARLERLGGTILILSLALLYVISIGQSAPSEWHIFGQSVRETFERIAEPINVLLRIGSDVLGAVMHLALLLLLVFFIWNLIVKKRLPIPKLEVFDELLERAWARYCLILLLLYLAIGQFHGFVQRSWFTTPWASEFNDVRVRYGEACTTNVQDGTDEGGHPYGHIEGDWSKAPRLCANLSREARMLYPGPAWLFGAPPDWEEGN